MKHFNMKLVLMLALFPFSGWAQGPNFSWAKSICSSRASESFAVTVDVNDDVYVTGMFDDTLDADPNIGVHQLVSNGDKDIFIQKLDSAGNLLWAHSFGGLGWDYGYDVVTDDQANVYLLGAYLDSVDFDPGVGTHKLYNTGSWFNGYVLKLNQQGDFVWAISLDGMELSNPASNIVPLSMAIDTTNHLYLTGEFDGDIDVDPGTGTTVLSSAGEFDVFLIKINQNGDHVWSHAIGGALTEQGSDLAIDAANNIYLTGSFESVMDFDWGAGTIMETPLSYVDAYLMKIEPLQGNVMWVDVFGGSIAQVGRSVACDALGHVYFSGMFNSTVDFDPGPGVHQLSAGATADVFVEKLDTSGNYIWVKSLETYSPLDERFNLCVDNNNDLYVASYFNNTVDFDPGAGVNNFTSNGFEDIFMSKVDQSGNFLWSMQIGSGLPDGPRGLACDPHGAIYLTGSFFDTIDFNPYADTAYLSCPSIYTNSFVLKMYTPTSTVDVLNNEKPNSLVVFPNPASGIVTLQTSEEITAVELYNLAGQTIRTYPAYTTTIDVSELPEAVYLVKVIGGENIFMRRLVKH
jgi:hypothetical protein